MGDFIHKANNRDQPFLCVWRNTEMARLVWLFVKRKKRRRFTSFLNTLSKVPSRWFVEQERKNCGKRSKKIALLRENVAFDKKKEAKESDYCFRELDPGSRSGKTWARILSIEGAGLLWGCRVSDSKYHFYFKLDFRQRAARKLVKSCSADYGSIPSLAFLCWFFSNLFKMCFFCFEPQRTKSLRFLRESNFEILPISYHRCFYFSTRSRPLTVVFLLPFPKAFCGRSRARWLYKSHRRWAGMKSRLEALKMAR